MTDGLVPGLDPDPWVGVEPWWPDTWTAFCPHPLCVVVHPTKPQAEWDHLLLQGGRVKFGEHWQALHTKEGIKP